MRRLPFLDTVPMPTIRLFTLTQLLVLACIFTITRFHFVDGFFPFLIAILVPVRLYLLPKLFGAAHVDAMDAVGAAPDEAVVDGDTEGGAGAGGMDVDVVATPETAHELTPPVPCRRGAVSPPHQLRVGDELTSSEYELKEGAVWVPAVSARQDATMDGIFAEVGSVCDVRMGGERFSVALIKCTGCDVLLAESGLGAFFDSRQRCINCITERAA